MTSDENGFDPDSLNARPELYETPEAFRYLPMDIPMEEAYLLWYVQRKRNTASAEVRKSRECSIAGAIGRPVEPGRSGVEMIHYLCALAMRLRALFGDRRADRELDD